MISISYADVHADGDLDVVLTQIAGPPLLLRKRPISRATLELKWHWNLDI